MGQYYSRVVSVLAWLGVGTELELAAMICIQKADVVKGNMAEREVPMTLDLLHGFRSIIANSYFERLWIVQEMARARNILLMLGTEAYREETTSWDHFNFAFLQIMMELKIISTTAIATHQELMLRQEIRDRKILLQLFKVKQDQDSLDIFDLIEAFSDFKCADPRDKLYGLRDIGCLRQQLFTVDYSKDAHEVYHDFLIECFRLANSGAALSNRQFDIMSKLAKVMGVQVDFQKITVKMRPNSAYMPCKGSRGSATSLQVRVEDIEMFKESLEHARNKDVRMFGFQYEEDTGDRISPYAKLGSDYWTPNVFWIPDSVDLNEVAKIAHQHLPERLGIDPKILLQSDEGEKADTITKCYSPDGYQTLIMITADLSPWQELFEKKEIKS